MYLYLFIFFLIFILLVSNSKVTTDFIRDGEKNVLGLRKTSNICLGQIPYLALSLHLKGQQNVL